MGYAHLAIKDQRNLVLEIPEIRVQVSHPSSTLTVHHPPRTESHHHGYPHRPRLRAAHVHPSVGACSPGSGGAAGYHPRRLGYGYGMAQQIRRPKPTSKPKPTDLPPLRPQIGKPTIWSV